MSCKGITKAQAIDIYSHWSMLEYGNNDMNDRSVQRGFINVSSRMAIGLHKQAKAFELTFFITKISL